MIQTHNHIHEQCQGYIIISEVEDPFFQTVFKAWRKTTGRLAILKMFSLEYLPSSLRRDICDEVTNLQSITSPVVIPMLSHQVVNNLGENTLLIAYEGTQGIPLGHSIYSFRGRQKRETGINDVFFTLAIQMAEAVREIHSRGLVHRGINPYEFMLIPEANRIMLNSFAWTHAWWPDHLTSDSLLPYIAPEQTGRMNLTVDFRANLYSLGVMFYEIVTGEPLFRTKDSLDTIYSHMARKPASPSDINPAVHGLISEVILKLLAKHPNDRYQSISGLIHDLETLESTYKNRSDPSRFALAQNDISPVFSIPDTLYGRSKELDFLKQCYHNVRHGENNIVIISGKAGVGKTELVRSLSGYVRGTGGLFFSGKFDRSREQVPNSGQKSLITAMVKWLLTLNQDEISAWKTKILDAISPNAQILADLIPDLELIIGKQPPLCELPPLEAHIRYKLVMDKFSSLFIGREHPVVYFLDDLHWADKKSIELALAFIMAKNKKHCLGICTYRNDKEEGDDLYNHFHERLQKAPIPVQRMVLPRLDQEQTGQMVAGILGKELNRISSLARIVYEKTKGNPLFIRHFMNSLFARGLIEYDMSTGSWTYAMERISLSRFTDDMDDLLSEKIRGLPRGTLTCLQAASCMGNIVDTELLNRLLPLSDTVIREHVQTSLTAGLLRRPREKNAHTVEFAHDQILQAIYMTMDRAKACRIHWNIAEAMVRRNPPDRTSKDIFDIVNQFSRGFYGKIPHSKRIELAGYYLLAGQKAMEAVSMESALAYLRSAKGFLGKDCWNDRFDQTFAIHNTLAKCLFILGETHDSEQMFHTLLNKASSTLDKMKVYNAMVELNTAVGNIKRALDLGRRALKLIRINLPESPGMFSLVSLFAQAHIRFTLWGMTSTPDTTLADNDHLDESLRLMANIGLPAFFMNPRLCLWIVSKGVALGIHHKKESFPIRFAPLGLITLGSIVGTFFGFTRLGKAYTEKGLALLKHEQPGPYLAITYFVSAFFNMHWFQPARKNLEHLKLAYSHALKHGDITYTSFSINMTSLTRMILGDNLEDVLRYHLKNESFIQKTRSPFIICFYTITAQVLKQLTGKESDLGQIPLDHPTLFNDNENSDILRFTYNLAKLKLHVMAHEWDPAMETIRTVSKIKHLPFGTLLVSEYYFYSCLAADGFLNHTASKKHRRFCRKHMAMCLKKMKRFAALCPENFEHLYHLMEGGKASISNKAHEAMASYRKAIHLCKERGNTHIAAMACESAGRLMMAENDLVAGRAYILESRQYFDACGAVSVSNRMEKSYACFFSATRDNHHRLPFSQVDYTSMVHAMQTLSKEIMVRKLLTRLMQIVIENTGANRAAFISVQNRELFIEVESLNGDALETQINTVPIHHSGDALLSSVANYVYRTEKPILMDDASTEPEFFVQIRDRIPSSKSVLCLPMSRSGRIVGILYLENTMAQGVFTHERMEFLKMVASQAAISLENARLYEHVTQNEQELKSLSGKLRELFSELLMTEERERRHIASDLHDRIGHALAAAKMGIETLGKTVEPEHRKTLDDIHAVIEQSILDTRTLVFELSPPILYHLGLPPALDWLCEETANKYPLSVVFHDYTDVLEPDVLSDHKINVLCFQSLRELMFNAVKHARAKTIEVILEVVDDTLNLTIVDDGKGLDSDMLSEKNKQSGGFGLFSINERLNLIGGRMTISSPPFHRGTRIQMMVPLMNDNHHGKDVS